MSLHPIMNYIHTARYVNLPVYAHIQSNTLTNDERFLPQRGENLYCDGLHYCFPPHLHDAAEFLYILDGAMCIESSQKTYLARAGELYCFNPYELHSAYINAETPSVKYIAVTAALDAVCQEGFPIMRQTVDAITKSKLSFRTVLSDSPAVRSAGEAMRAAAEMQDHQNTDGAAEFAIMGALYTMLSQLITAGALSPVGADSAASAQFMRRVSLFIEEHYTQDITPELLFSEFPYHPNYFGRMFKAHFGKPFRSYLNDYRIKCAMELLLSGDGISMHAVAARVGFSDYCYFSHVFKRHTGVSASEYVKLRTQRR